MRDAGTESGYGMRDPIGMQDRIARRPTCYDNNAMMLLVVASLTLLSYSDTAVREPDLLQDAPAAIGARLMQDAAIKSAVERVRRDEPQVLEEQARLCEIPAPPFKEAKRAEAFRQAFASLGLKNVRIDGVGNVIGERPGLAARPHLVFSAHLDTVFPEDTRVQTSRNGAILKGPGISDDCRGLAVLLGVIRAMNAAAVQTPGTISFVGTVGEEGLGDLRGVKHLFNAEMKGGIDRFVSVDGAGLGLTHIGVGSLRYRVAFKGPGGHSYGAFGIANPVHALGRAIDKIADLQVPREPKTTFNVGRIGGGTSVNAIPAEAWMEVDLRSSDKAALTALDASFQRALDVALAEENERWGGRGRLTLEKTVVGNRPAGRTAADAPIVQAAVSVGRALGLETRLDEGSTDANLAMSLGIPAITIDAGGSASGTHSLAETFDSTGSWQGTARALLLAVALAGR
jgi:acetylornithine deacetylase/succinyl-diaminopimelate desuccinylase-like protein